MAERTHGRSLQLAARNFVHRRAFLNQRKTAGCVMSGIIYLVGLVVVVGIILSFFGLR